MDTVHPGAARIIQGIQKELVGADSKDIGGRSPNVPRLQFSPSFPSRFSLDARFGLGKLLIPHGKHEFKQQRVTLLSPYMISNENFRFLKPASIVDKVLFTVPFRDDSFLIFFVQSSAAIEHCTCK